LLCFIIACTPQTVTKIEEFAAQPIPKEALELTGQALVDYVNQRQSFFKAEYSPEVAEYRLGNLMKAHFVEQPREEGYELTTDQLIANNSDLPEKVMLGCLSCFGYVRSPLHPHKWKSEGLVFEMKGTNPGDSYFDSFTMLSDTDILACCGKFCGYGCEGGYNGRAWKWATISGVVSGGRYGEKVTSVSFVELITATLNQESLLEHSKYQEIIDQEFLAQPITKEAEELTGEALVKYVNERQSFFKAKYSPEVVKKRRQFLLKPQFIERSYNQENVLPIANMTSNDDIPESFDSREEWKDCPSLRVIPDQSNCGSCWAVSAAQCMSDRLCIHSQGRKKVLLSATDILACCGKFCGYGGCKFIWIPNGFSSFLARTWYWLPNDERTIQLEIMKKGPVHATFNIYEDFEHYNGGVYIHTAGRMEGGHSIKIIGWGVDKGVKYWLIANSWSTDWGEDGEEFLSKSIPKEAEELAGEALVEYVNNQQPFFQAEYSAQAEQRMQHLMRMEFDEKHEQNAGLSKEADPVRNDFDYDIPER
uniref:Pept_C1 domain-containing protein n=1 Tax=Haemonchus placei TaxID=6290 RepID=A0A158QR03_HAEPC